MYIAVEKVKDGTYRTVYDKAHVRKAIYESVMSIPMIKKIGIDTKLICPVGIKATY